MTSHFARRTVHDRNAAARQDARASGTVFKAVCGTGCGWGTGVLALAIWATAAAPAAAQTAPVIDPVPVYVVQQQPAATPRRATPAVSQTPSQTPSQAPARQGGAEASLAAGLGSEAATFYARRGFAPLWLDGGATPLPRAEVLVAALLDAESHALAPETYDAVALARAVVGSGRPADAEALERRLTRAYLAYARDLASGVLEPSRVDGDLHVEPPRPDPARLLADMAAARDPAAFLAGLAPQHPDYARLRVALARFRDLARDPNTWGPTIGGGETLRPGARAPAVAALRQRLAALGDLEAEAAGDTPTVLAANDVSASDAEALPAAFDPRLYDDAVVAAVKRFQARHGLNTDGIVGPATRAALNRGPGHRARQIAVNLERLRWLNRPLGARHIHVNIADFSMRLVEDGETVFATRTVVGKREHQTPEFSDVMEHMVVNPTWYVPASIAREEILPRLAHDPNYLSERNMTRHASGRITQGPGPNNALGRVKFMFPNDYAIYLHDTPSRSLFRRDVRAYSHGCVRVQEPAELAHALLRDQVADPEARFSRWVRSGREIYVNLDRPLPVHLTYRTAWVGEDGGDRFREDVYGRDATVAAALQAQGIAVLGR